MLMYMYITLVYIMLVCITPVYISLVYSMLVYITLVYTFYTCVHYTCVQYSCVHYTCVHCAGVHYICVNFMNFRSRFYYWNLETDEVSWLPPQHPRASISLSAERLQGKRSTTRKTLYVSLVVF